MIFFTPLGFCTAERLRLPWAVPADSGFFSVPPAPESEPPLSDEGLENLMGLMIVPVFFRMAGRVRFLPGKGEVGWKPHSSADKGSWGRRRT